MERKEIFSYTWIEVVSIQEVLQHAENGAEAIRLELEDGDLIGISSEDIILLCDSVHALVSVKALCLINCGMTLEDFQMVFDALNKMTSLEYLDVSSNPLETEGTKILAEYLRGKKLKHLNISNCNVSSTGLSYVVDELENNSSLRSVVLDNNPDLSTNAIVSLYEAVKRKNNIIQLSTLNTYCDVKSMASVFKILKKHLNVMYLGFPTFFQRKKNFVDSLLDSEDSLLEVHKEDLLKFRDVIVQKALYDALKTNFSLVKVFNKHVRPDVRGLLKRNLSLMKNEFNNILLNGEAVSSDFSQQSLLVLGRRGSGKTQVVQSLFGAANCKETVDFELNLRESVVKLQKDENLRIQVSNPRQDECRNFSFSLAAKILSKSRGELRNNEKYIKLSKVVCDSNTPLKRKSNRRQQLSFYQYPDGQSRPNNNRPTRQVKNNKGPTTGNSLLHSYRNRSRKRANKNKKSSRSSYKLDQPLQNRRVSLDRRERALDSAKEMKPNMRKSEIVDNFNPQVVATHGDLGERFKVLVNILEVSARVSNSISSTSKEQDGRSTASGLAGDSKRKQTEADKFGRINSSLIDLNHLCFGVEGESGVLLLTFNIPKLLKYIQVEEERMIVHNPITAFLRHNIRIAYSKSPALSLFLVGTGFEESAVSEKALSAINLIIQNTVNTKDFKRLIRYRRNKNVLCFHPVDVSKPESTGELRKSIIKRLYKNAKSKIKEKLPVKYLRAYDILKQEGVPFLSKQDIIELVEEANIQPDGIDDLIAFLKTNNLILHYSNVDILSDFIILDKKYFYRLMYQFVNRRYITKVLNNKDIREAAKENKLGKDLMVFKSKKLISTDLIEFVWTNNPNYDQLLSKGTYLYLIEVLKKSLFLTPWQNIRYNLSAFSEVATPITSQNIAEFTTENLFLLTSCVKQAGIGKQNKHTRIRNVRSFAEASSRKSRGQPLGNKESRSSSKKGYEAFDARSKSLVRSRIPGSFEGVLFSSRAKCENRSSVRGRLKSKGDRTNERSVSVSSKQHTRKRNRVKSGYLEKGNKKVISLQRPKLEGPSSTENKDLINARTRTRYLLNKNKPVSILIDFKTSFLPTGLFFRLSSALYSLIVKAIKDERRGFKKGIESVELHQNLFKIKFNRVMTTHEEVLSDRSTHGSASSIYSEAEEISVSNSNRMGQSVDSKQEDKEFIALIKNETKACIIMVVRDHDMAPKYLRLLDAALELILPQKEDVGDVNDFMTMFYNVQLSKRMVKVEVKNNKFISLEVAERRRFAPWFAKNKRINSS